MRNSILTLATLLFTFSMSGQLVVNDAVEIIEMSHYRKSIGLRNLNGTYYLNFYNREYNHVVDIQTMTMDSVMFVKLADGLKQLEDFDGDIEDVSFSINEEFYLAIDKVYWSRLYTLNRMRPSAYSWLSKSDMEKIYEEADKIRPLIN